MENVLIVNTKILGNFHAYDTFTITYCILDGINLYQMKILGNTKQIFNKTVFRNFAKIIII